MLPGESVYGRNAVIAYTLIIVSPAMISAWRENIEKFATSTEQNQLTLIIAHEALDRGAAKVKNYVDDLRGQAPKMPEIPYSGDEKIKLE